MAIRHDLDATPLLPVLPIAALREIERRHAHEPLMERAGAAAADIAAAMLAGRAGRIVALAGPGNNGGDAFVCARRLRERGFDVVVVARADPVEGDAANSRSALIGAGVPMIAAPPSDPPALIVDGLFGVGLSRAPGAPWSV
jgi:ADP-dependent NAD(P)H-hydrate dehydratase / NAD(P)H-hydrate epimerase